NCTVQRTPRPRWRSPPSAVSIAGVISWTSADATGVGASGAHVHPSIRTRAHPPSRAITWTSRSSTARASVSPPGATRSALPAASPRKTAGGAAATEAEGPAPPAGPDDEEDDDEALADAAAASGSREAGQIHPTRR